MHRGGVLFLALVAASGRVPAQRPSTTAAARAAIIVAEDARGAVAQGVAPILEGLGHPDPVVQRVAVRALGRLERPDLIDRILPMLAASSPEVRAEAANALAQALASVALPGALVEPRPAVGREISVAGANLLARMQGERDPHVLDAIARALGRLPYQSAEDIRRTEAALVERLAAEGPRGTAGRLGAVRGLETLIRLHGKTVPLQALTVARLRALVTEGASRPEGISGSDQTAEVRRLALTAVTAAGAGDAALARVALADDDSQVRRLAAVLLARDPLRGDVTELLDLAVTDRDPMVRYDAVRAYGARRAASGCGPLVRALDDPSPHVALAAIDQLADCGDGAPTPRLREVVRAFATSQADGPAAMSWHVPAHALVALSRLAPEAVGDLLPRLADHPVWQVRMYVARAAANAGQATLLRSLATDDHDNVREAAIAGLARTVGHDADAVYREALTGRDYQLVRTAARALEGTRDRSAAIDALHTALARLTAERRDTSRDVRLALLERLREVGSPSGAERLEPYLRDFDPRIASLAATILTDLTGTSHVARPVPLRPPDPPDAAELAALETTRARVVMRRGGSFELTLHPDEAPGTCTRFIRLARAGYYDGLTFHRVVPNFVLQGGSPGANEYAGDGPYLRDEVGLRPHRRGSVGISTRGRDTGDAQIFIDLVDIPRLDHMYTVFATVTRGLETVDGILEGDVIERVEVSR